MSNTIAARVRTWWPLLLGHLAAVLVAWAQPALIHLAPLGVHIDQAVAYEVLSFLLAGAVWEAGRFLERWPARGRAAGPARALGRFLLSLGLRTGQPLYPAARTDGVRLIDPPRTRP